MAEEKSLNEAKRKKRLWWQVPLLVFLILGTFYIGYRQHSQPYQKETGFVFGTVYNVTYQHDTSLKEEIEAELKEVDHAMSMFNEESVVSRLNRGEQPELSEIFLDVYQKSCEINKETDGAFDISVAPLVNAWGFGFKHEQLPTQHEVDSLLRFVGMSHLRLDEQKHTIVKDDPRVMLDFSAIAKGYGSDCVARVLARHGVENYMVEIGGEVVTRGISPKRLPWRIGVTKPTDDSLVVTQEMQTVLNVTDMAMATSGNYRNFYYHKGRKYAHTIDPKTGFPVQHSILSATVLSADCASADAYATAFMVLGLDRAKSVLERHPELMAYFIYSDEQGNYAVWYSPQLKDKINE